MIAVRLSLHDLRLNFPLSDGRKHEAATRPRRGIAGLMHAVVRSQGVSPGELGSAKPLRDSNPASRDQVSHHRWKSRATITRWW